MQHLISTAFRRCYFDVRSNGEAGISLISRDVEKEEVGFSAEQKEVDATRALCIPSRLP